MSTRIVLEIAVASVDDALAAQGGGADRLELNAALAHGGLTPSLATLIEVKQTVALPVFVMVRPRPGGFCYGAADFRIMQRDIELSLAHGADGLVFGVLTEDRRVDVPRCRELIRQAGENPVVFHRAFDVTPDPFAALEQLIDLGVRRVLTSGQEVSAYNGAATIAELIRRAAGRIEVLPAAGINRFTVADVVARTGCDQVHASLRGTRTDPSTAARPHISFGGAGSHGEDRHDATDPAAVAELRRQLDQ
ncbi:MAG TPA: copper homeostasis protein CutC [Gemmataceae bacterium]|jgi:copper homeostasis protein